MNNLQINTQPTTEGRDANKPPTNNSTNSSNSLRLPHYFEKKGYRAIKVIGEGAYGKALLVSTALAKPSLSAITLPGSEGKSSTRSPSSKGLEKRRDDTQAPSQDPSAGQQVPPLVVIKHVNMAKFSKAERAAAKNEVGMLKMLNHPNIVHYYESVEVDVDQLYICLEYADGGDLAAKIKKNREVGVCESDMLSLFRQVVDAVGYMHSQKVLHRDLKPQNIFLSKDGTQVKVGDFGFSKALNYTFAMANTLCGTPYYYSPELCKGKPYNSASDVWALGVMLYEMFSHKVPFDARSIPQLAAAICTKEPSRPKDMSDPVWLLLCELLCKNPLGRPDCAVILKHPVLKAYSSSDISNATTAPNEQPMRERRSSTPSLLNQLKASSPTDLPPPTRTPLALGRKDSIPESAVLALNTYSDDTHRQRPTQQGRQHQAGDNSIRPPSRVHHPSLLPPRHPGCPPPTSMPGQQRDKRVDTESKSATPSRRPSLQSLKVSVDNNLAGCTTPDKNSNQDRPNNNQHNIFDTLKGLPAIQHPLRLPTPIKHNSADPAKIAMA